MRKLTPALRDEIRRRKRAGDTQREIGRAVGVSHTTVGLVLAEPEPAAGDIVVRVAATDVQRRAWALAELRLEHPDVADELTRGETLAGALANNGVIDAAWFNDAATLAELVRDATDWPGSTEDAPKGEDKSELARAVKLLEAALARVRRDGIAPRWRKRSPAPKRKARP